MSCLPRAPHPPDALRHPPRLRGHHRPRSWFALSAPALALWLGGGCSAADESASGASGAASASAGAATDTSDDPGVDVTSAGSGTGGESTSTGDSGGETSSGTSSGSGDPQPESGDSDGAPPPSPNEGPADTPDTASCSDDARVRALGGASPGLRSTAALVRDALLRGVTDLGGLPLREAELFHDADWRELLPPATTTAGLPVRLAATVSEDPSDARNLQLQVTAMVAPTTARAPTHVVLVLDTSDSIAGAAAQGLRAAASAVASGLRAGDRLSIVTWSPASPPQLEAHAVEAGEDPKVREALDAVELGGSSSLTLALDHAYDLAQTHAGLGLPTRVLLITDGRAATTEVDTATIAAGAAAAGAASVRLSVIGVGEPMSYGDGLGFTLAQLGGGAALYVGDGREAATLVGDALPELLEIAGLDATVELALPSGWTALRPADAASEALTVPDLGRDRALVLRRTLQRCDAAANDASSSALVTVRIAVPTGGGPREEAATFELPVPLDPVRSLDAAPKLVVKGDAIARYAAAISAFRAAPGASATREAIATALATLAGALDLLEGDADLLRMVQVLEALP